MIVARTQVKTIMKDLKIGVDNISADFLDRLDDEVKSIIIKACHRAKENSRRTVMGRDI